MGKKVKILILAGGKGSRMNSILPKVLIRVQDKPLIRHLLSSVEKSHIDTRPTIVVGYGREEVKAELGEKYNYAIQEEQKGTGHAVMIAQKMLENKADHVMVLYGDHPFVSPTTIKKLAEKHLKEKATLTLATVTLSDFNDWRSIFYDNFSRIVRDERGNIEKDIQFKDANDEEKEITEVNPCYFIFDARWLWLRLKTLNKSNAQKEYYLTDLIKIAILEKTKVSSINIEPEEALGVNSKTELEIVERLAQKK